MTRSVPFRSPVRCAWNGIGNEIESGYGTTDGEVIFAICNGCITCILAVAVTGCL